MAFGKVDEILKRSAVGRKLRKLINNPRTFFVDSKLFAIRQNSLKAQFAIKEKANWKFRKAADPEPRDGIRSAFEGQQVMTLAALENANQKVRQAADAEPLGDMANLLSHVKQNPYYGFVEVHVPNAPTFVMFSNNDDAVAMQAFWQRPFSYEAHSLQLWMAAAKQSRAIADIGSYTGLFSLLAAAVNRRTRVLTFEAVDFI